MEVLSRVKVDIPTHADMSASDCRHNPSEAKWKKRLRVFVSSTLKELAPERRAAHSLPTHQGRLTPGGGSVLETTTLHRWSARKGLSKEVSSKGIRVIRVSAGWVETEAAVGLVNELAANKVTDFESARKALMTRSAVSRSDDRPDPAKWRSSSPFSPRRAPPRSPARNT